MEELYLAQPPVRDSYLTTKGLYVPRHLSIEETYMLARWLNSEEVKAMLVCIQQGWEIRPDHHGTAVSIPAVPGRTSRALMEDML